MVPYLLNVGDMLSLGGLFCFLNTTDVSITAGVLAVAVSRCGEEDVDSGFLARSIDSSISFQRILYGDMLIVISFWCTGDDVLFEVFPHLFSSLRQSMERKTT